MKSHFNLKFDLKTICKIVFLLYPATFVALWFARKIFCLTIPEEGSLGDSISGILSPFINCITIYLLYISFNQQKDTHDLEKANQDFHLLNNFLDAISEKTTIDSTINNLLSTAYAYNYNTDQYDTDYSPTRNPFYGYHILRNDIENLISVFDRVKHINECKATWLLSVEQKMMIDWQIHDITHQASIKKLLDAIEWKYEPDEDLENKKSGLLLELHGVWHPQIYRDLERKLKQSIIDIRQE